jgi:hypothetical protein
MIQMNDNDSNNKTGHDNKDGAIDKTPPKDPGAFDLSRLRLSQNFSESLNVKKAILTVPVRKPDRQWFIRVRPGEEWRFQTAVLELKDERETYLVDRPLWEELAGEVIPKVLFTAVNRHDICFLWPLRLPGADGRLDAWNQSGLEAAELATKSWISVRANMQLGAYEIFEAAGEVPEPTFPEHSLEQLVKIAFKNKLIASTDHPVLRRLRGET